MADNELLAKVQDLFKLEKSLTPDEHVIYASAYANAIYDLAPKDDPHAFVNSLRAAGDRYHDLANLVEGFLLTAEGKMMDEEDDPDEEEPDADEDDKGDKPKGKDDKPKGD